MIKLENRNGYSVLDHGHVALVESMGNDLSIVRNARVSYDAEWRTGEDSGKDEKLIKYLVKNNHTSPFECVQFTFDIKCPIFVARQLLRHRTLSANEISARYAELPEEFYIPDLQQMGVQHSDNKQMRDADIILPEDVANNIRDEMTKQNKEAFNLYHSMIERGLARELARTVLPVGTYTHLFFTMNLHNLMHFIKLRSNSHAQYEIRVYSDAILEIIKSVVPVSVAAFEEYKLNSN